MIAELKIGDRLRRPNGELFHVRGFVDEQVVLRWWRAGKKRWQYVVEDSTAFTVGLYVRDTASNGGDKS